MKNIEDARRLHVPWLISEMRVGNHRRHYRYEPILGNYIGNRLEILKPWIF